MARREALAITYTIALVR